MMLRRNLVAVAVLVVAGIALIGCGKTEPAATPVAQTKEAKGAHDGWWCDEHGVPEEVCTRCNSKLVAGFKAKGDWCKKHNRPDSQCFICHPEKEAEFVAQYEAKYGKKPPKPESEHTDHDHDHDHKKPAEKS